MCKRGEEGTREIEQWINIQECVDGDVNSLCLTSNENKANPVKTETAVSRFVSRELPLNWLAMQDHKLSHV